MRSSAVALAVEFGTHAIDHVRRGMSAATMLIMIGGGAEALSIAIAVFMVLTRRAWAAQAAIVVRFGTALASTYGHLLPTISPGFRTASSMGRIVNGVTRQQNLNGNFDRPQ